MCIKSFGGQKGGSSEPPRTPPAYGPASGWCVITESKNASLPFSSGSRVNWMEASIAVTTWHLCIDVANAVCTTSYTMLTVTWCHSESCVPSGLDFKAARGLVVTIVSVPDPKPTPAWIAFSITQGCSNAWTKSCWICNLHWRGNNYVLINVPSRFGLVQWDCSFLNIFCSHIECWGVHTTSQSIYEFKYKHTKNLQSVLAQSY